MCRWFAYISATEPCLLEDVLVVPKHSIVKQVNEHYLPKIYAHSTAEADAVAESDSVKRNNFFNEDGFGVAYYTYTQEEYGEVVGPRPQLYRSIQPPGNDSNFMSLCQNTSTRCAFAHVRAATSVVHSYNNHPFQFGRHVFQHNGSVDHFDLIRMKMLALMSPKAMTNIHGSTDSEHIAGLYMTYLGEDWNKQYPVAEMKAALDKAISTIIQLQTEINPPPSDGLQPSSLNLCTTDGEQLVAARFRNVKGDEHQPPSLYFSTSAGVSLNRKYPGHPDDPTYKATGTKPAESHGEHLIIASEPTTFDENQWTLVPKNKDIVVGKDMRVTIEEGPVGFTSFEA